jgi:hypothetical protein
LSDPSDTLLAETLKLQSRADASGYEHGASIEGTSGFRYPFFVDGFAMLGIPTGV